MAGILVSLDPERFPADVGPTDAPVPPIRVGRAAKARRAVQNRTALFADPREFSEAGHSEQP